MRRRSGREHLSAYQRHGGRGLLLPADAAGMVCGEEIRLQRRSGSDTGKILLHPNIVRDDDRRGLSGTLQYSGQGLLLRLFGILDYPDRMVHVTH